MTNASDAETLSLTEVGEVLDLLPALRRWLLRSMPGRPPGFPRPPLSQLRVLVHVCWRGPMTMGELAHDLGISCSTATELVAELESTGRIVRKRSDSDRRRVIVTLTPESEAVAGRIINERKGVVEEAFAELSPRERRTFIKGLALLAGAAEARLGGAQTAGERASV